MTDIEVLKHHKAALSLRELTSEHLAKMRAVSAHLQGLVAQRAPNLGEMKQVVQLAEAK